MVIGNADGVEATSAGKYSPEVMAKISELTTPYFVRTLLHAHGGYHMELPAKFVKEHGGEFRTYVSLEGPTGEMWGVQLWISHSNIQDRVRFSKGWHDFFLANAVEKGDLLVFSLVDKSKFAVTIFSQNGKLVQRGQANGTSSKDDSETEEEEVVRGGGKVSRLTNGKLVAGEKVEDCTTMSSYPWPWPELDGLIELPAPSRRQREISNTNTNTADTVCSDAEENSWPTWNQLFGIKDQHE